MHDWLFFFGGVIFTTLLYLLIKSIISRFYTTFYLLGDVSPKRIAIVTEKVFITLQDALQYIREHKEDVSITNLLTIKSFIRNE